MTTTWYVPKETWLALLADGWRFADWTTGPMLGHHGHYCILMVRDA